MAVSSVSSLHAAPRADRDSPQGSPDEADIVIVGAGAAGLMALIAAGRAQPDARVVAFDGATRLGAKILVAGGGRCNVTHDEVDATVYAGSSRNAINKVLRQFTVPQTLDFFREIGVELKREETGKLFPITDSARTVLDALLNAALAAGGQIVHPFRIERIDPAGSSFMLTGRTHPQAETRTLSARRVILATGGRSLPKSGSDGGGYTLARALGHSLTDAIFPALVPLVTPPDHFTRALSGIALVIGVSVKASSGRMLIAFTNSALCTHFGLSGPAILDVSRYLTEARQTDPGAQLIIDWLPTLSREALDKALQQLGRAQILSWLRDHLPERLARALLDEAGIDPALTGDALTRDARRRLLDALCAMPIPVQGDRGFTYAEVTAGGVPLREVRLETLESRLCPGAYLCGELLDVDGRIGGYNFQWAWASGVVAGAAAARSLQESHLQS